MRFSQVSLDLLPFSSSSPSLSIRPSYDLSVRGNAALSELQSLEEKMESVSQVTIPTALGESCFSFRSGAWSTRKIDSRGSHGLEFSVGDTPS